MGIGITGVVVKMTKCVSYWGNMGANTDICWGQSRASPSGSRVLPGS